MTRLYFIRHGETDWNREGRLQGHTDTPLNAKGRRQAAAVGGHLKELVASSGRGVALNELPFFASPLLRTRQTIEILREAAGLPPEAYQREDRLKEIAFGAWEGRTWSEVRSRDPIRAKDRDRDRWTFVPPGGESYALVLERVQPWFETIRQDTCMVAHGGIARVMMVLCGGMTPAEAVEADIWQGRILVFEEGTMRWLPE